MVRGRQRALVGQGRLGLGREVAPFGIPQPTPVGHTEAPQHHEPLKLLPQWHQINNTWGTNPSPRQDGSPMPRGAWTGEQDEHLDALRPSQGAQDTQGAPARWHRERIQGQGAPGAPAAAPPAWRGSCRLCIAVPWDFLYVQMCSREWAQTLWALPCSSCFAGEVGMDKSDGNRKELKKKKMGGSRC